MKYHPVICLWDMDRKGCGEEAMESKDHFCAYSWSVSCSLLLYLN